MKPLVKDTVGAEIPVFQAIYETASGGFMLDETVLAAGTTVKMGTVIGFDETTRKAKVAKYAVNKNASGTSDTTYEVYKGHNLAVGMSIKEVGGAAYAITAIDTSNPNHDVITVGTTLSADAVAAGAILFVDDIGVSMAKGLLLDETVIATGVDVSVVLRGTVYENRIAPVDATLKALMPHIIFSKSY
jgi:hypothetical protein